MPKKAYLKSYLSETEIKNRYLQIRDRVESRRWHLLWLVSQNWTIKEAAQALGLNYDYAKDIVKNYNQKGPDGILNRRKTRKFYPSHALLTLEQQEQLRMVLKSPPQDQAVWTGPKVAEWIAKTIGRDRVSPQRGWEYMKKCSSNV
ncbi:MAG: helix-turn-helix domain-containing protein [Trichodesmium sp. St16_bin4-tuft]|nr:helix-turn-helix domain-containing protein [Trichodesmium sp. MAG_R01]MDE5068445.1 helix-turn-helix domain-containing protein [Trichodesmium sp. St4_bin8_1]MDE5074488.1 helix-turn-helix domain-containing protein [Trichodesmium sp. St5_bin8]MDE5078857.1 helix-turn-helix domain-containing protein [Trichodesmium sp. St2_bin6]MDE5091512.1 helix-turn-helix domain-containing protein [Trichodesmium sp. St18_bin3_1_1]MDE5100171.1 helix-turn-helix domain-containing protein [Trichodesmium sp. St16_bi